MSGKGKRRRRPEKSLYLMTQAERARQLAAEAGVGFVADLYQIHAEICERRAKDARHKRIKTDSKTGI